MTEETNQTSDLDNILDMTLDDLADAPSIELFPNGAHKVKIEFKVNERKKTNITMEMEYVEVAELADPTAVAPAAGDKSFVFFNLKKKDGTANEFSQGALKVILKSLHDQGFAGNTPKEVMDSAKGAEVIVVTKIREGKGEYEGKDQIDIVSVSVV